MRRNSAIASRHYLCKTCRNSQQTNKQTKTANLPQVVFESDFEFLSGAQIYAFLTRQKSARIRCGNLCENSAKTETRNAASNASLQPIIHFTFFAPFLGFDRARNKQRTTTRCLLRATRKQKKKKTTRTNRRSSSRQPNKQKLHDFSLRSTCNSHICKSARPRIRKPGSADESKNVAVTYLCEPR